MAGVIVAILLGMLSATPVMAAPRAKQAIKFDASGYSYTGQLQSLGSTRVVFLHKVAPPLLRETSSGRA